MSSNIHPIHSGKDGRVNTVLSSQDHNNITAKLQNNDQWASPEV